MKQKSSPFKKWKKAFSQKKENQKVKNPSKQKNDNISAGTSLTLIRKLPVSFRLSRLENPVDFERMSFVIKACEKSANSHFKSVLHVEQTRTGSRLVATDGKRLHVAEISKKIKTGDYKFRATKDVIFLGKSIKGIKFPVWSKAIPENTEKRGIINLTDSGMGKDRQETEKLSIAYNSFVQQTGEPVNLRYLEDLTKREWAVYCQGEKRKAIVLREKSSKPDAKVPLAVILPIQQAA